MPSSDWTMTFPSPPTVNNYYTVSRGRKILSQAGRDYKASMATRMLLARMKRPIDGPVVVTLHWTRATKIGDLENRFKPLFDAIKGYAFHDDKQIVEIHAYRHDGGTPGITVTINTTLEALCPK